MGYMDISIGGSDRAFDTHCGAARTLLNFYKKELDNAWDNSYNTPTCLNVAMSFNTLGTKFWLEALFIFDDGETFLTDLNDQLTECLEQCRAWHKADGDSNSSYHLEEYGKIIKSFRRKKYAIEEELLKCSLT